MICKEIAAGWVLIDNQNFFTNHSGLLAWIILQWAASGIPVRSG